MSRIRGARILSVFRLVCALFALALVCFGQGDRGLITGRVTDAGLFIVFALVGLSSIIRSIYNQRTGKVKRAENNE
jgi:hypothetical protein